MIVVLKQNSDKGHVEKLMQHFTDMRLHGQYADFSLPICGRLQVDKPYRFPVQW